MATVLSYTNSMCGCGRLWAVEMPIDLPSFETEDSNSQPNTAGYRPIVDENSEVEYIFYVPEDYNEMSTPKKFSELDLATDLEGARFVIITPGEVEGEFDNYVVEFDEMVSFVAPMLRLPYEVEETGETITVAAIAEKPVQAIMMPNLTLTSSQFTQVNNSITYVGNEFYEGDKIVFIF